MYRLLELIFDSSGHCSEVRGTINQKCIVIWCNIVTQNWVNRIKYIYESRPHLAIVQL